jgi:hypothetical protein
MGGVSGRIGELIAHLARAHERRARESFAGGLERVVEEVDRPWRRGGAAVPIDRPAVAEAAPLLLQLAARLRVPEPIPVEAMRRVRALVSDGPGPLYALSAHRSQHSPGTLTVEAQAILRLCDEPAVAAEPREFVRS